jgi:hypothetical protein
MSVADGSVEREAGLDERTPVTGRVAVLITYTMIQPVVAGAFFRALRLAQELSRRGWQPVICNNGPELEDPKITKARPWLRYVPLDSSKPGFGPRAARAEFLALDPEVLVMGEGPFETMRVFYAGAKQTGRPFAVLDQYYSPTLLPHRRGVDVVLLYGLETFWRKEIQKLRRPYVMVPPFINGVTPRSRLPAPTWLLGDRLITFIAYEDHCLREGAELLRTLEDSTAVVVSISHNPPMAARLLQEAGLDRDRTVVLPLQSDEHVFGFLHASRLALLSNGFIQIMDALALACPVIALARPGGAGMNHLNISDRFEPYVSLNDNREDQYHKMNRWLHQSPFPPALREELGNERGGAVRSADLVERIASWGPHRVVPRWRRLRS